MATVRIPLTRGKFAIVDAADAESVLRFKWMCDLKRGKYYVSRRVGNGRVYLQRFLMGEPEGMFVDHINRDGIDNRIENLRLATKADNQRNQGLSKSSTTGYKGVSFVRTRNKYVATIKHNYKTHCLGYYDNPKDAARAYNAAALERFGEFAWLNEVD